MIRNTTFAPRTSPSTCPISMADIAREVMSIHTLAPLDRDIIGVAMQPIDEGTDWIAGKDCYAWYYSIASVVRPRRVAEIGVRFGYSLKAICAAHMDAPMIGNDARNENARSGKLQIWGFDNECYMAGSNEIAYTMLKGLANVWIGTVDTRHLIETENSLRITRTIDLFSIDGDHSYDGTMNDLDLAFAATRDGGYILLDDTNKPEVEHAAHDFCIRYGLGWWRVPSKRGMLLIQARSGGVADDATLADFYVRPPNQSNATGALL